MFNNLPMNSDTGSLSPSPRIEPVISSFSTIGKNNCTNSGEYGCVIVSKTCFENNIIIVSNLKKIMLSTNLSYKISNK